MPQPKGSPTGGMATTTGSLVRAAAHLVTLPRMEDERGSLSFIEAGEHVPFQIERIYYLMDVPAGIRRGGHAHATSQQVIIAIVGSVEVTVDNGITSETHKLDRSDLGLYIPNLTWRDLQHFSPTAVCLVLSSQHYDATDYLDSYDEFTAIVRSKHDDPIP